MNPDIAYHREQARAYIERGKQFRDALKAWDCPDEDAIRDYYDDAVICARMEMNAARAAARAARMEAA